MTLIMKTPYFFAGEDLSNQPTAEAFNKMICKKAGLNADEVTVVPGTWDNSHSQYVIAAFQIKADEDEAEDQMHKFCDWFWDDPKHIGKYNQLLKFEAK